MDGQTNALKEPPPGWYVNDKGELVMQAESESDEENEIDELTKDLATAMEEPDKDEDEEEGNELFEGEPCRKVGG